MRPASCSRRWPMNDSIALCPQFLRRLRSSQSGHAVSILLQTQQETQGEFLPPPTHPPQECPECSSTEKLRAGASLWGCSHPILISKSQVDGSWAGRSHLLDNEGPRETPGGIALCEQTSLRQRRKQRHKEKNSQISPGSLEAILFIGILIHR